MIDTTTNRQIFRKLQAIESAEHYLIARTRHEIRATRSASAHANAPSRIMLATSAACMAGAFLLVQVWPYIAAATSV
jgi:hypothetical protein